MPNGDSNNDLRLIEDYLPIEAISKEASREKSVRKGHISTLHLWWARRPLVACRAAVYGALVPADRWVKDINVKNAEGKDVEAFKNGTKKGLNRKHAKEFVTKLCRYPKTDPSKPEDIKLKRDTEAAIIEAQKHILEAHADRLTLELKDAKKTGKAPAWVEEFTFKTDKVTYDDIVAGRAPRPRVLDMFAGGGAIPLEALRLGCEAYALDLNPVAHIIQLCTLVYPQKYGKPDPAVRGMTGPKNAKRETTWGGLADEVRYWGNWVLERVRKEIGDLYPLIPDPNYKPGKNDADAAKKGASGKQMMMDEGNEGDELSDESDVVDVPPGFLIPIAYLWTRTVCCKNPSCAKTVPLVRQTWLCQKKGRYAALKPIAEKNASTVRFEVIEASTEPELGFDAESFSTGGNATCPWCGAVADSDYVKREGCEGRLGQQMMAIAFDRPRTQGKVFISADELPIAVPNAQDIARRTQEVCASALIGIPQEVIEPRMTGGICLPYGLTNFGKLLGPRQLLSMLTFAAAVRKSEEALAGEHIDREHIKCLATYMGLAASRMANFSTTMCLWNYTGGRGVVHSFSRQALSMTWDFPESNPFYGEAAGWLSSIAAATSVLGQLPVDSPAVVSRGSAISTQMGDAVFDAVITDPPYYDNIDYAKLSDFFYVWLKRSIGHLHGEHFSADNTPKKGEIVADPVRHGRSRTLAKQAYEKMMSDVFKEASRVLKPSAPMAVVYAHKTTLGWTTVIDALRRSGFTVTEAWPLDTERPGGMKVDKAMLASGIFLVAHKREIIPGVGNYEDDVQPDLQHIVRERVETLWEMGIAGADLVIACVGAGLRAFTKYEKVEYANGEEVPAEKFLAEVEGVVLDTMMGKLSGVVGGNVAAVDPASRFYVLWRFVYKAAEIDAGEAIVFTYAQHVELDGSGGLSDGTRAMMKDLDSKQDYSPVLTHDLVGPNARAKRIDERLAKETPALANVKPAARISTAILAFSFGGLKRDGEESLPPGVGETELLAACVGPDLDSITASGVLGELRNSCLYLHYDGVRYCFKKDPNVTKLIEEAEQEVSRDSDGIRDQIKEMLEKRLSGKDAIVWPQSTQDLPDKEPRFLVGYMPLDFAGKNGAQQDDAAKTMLSKYGDTPRRYRNGVGLAVPEKKPIESLRRAVRYIMAIERVESRTKQHKLTKDQTDQLKERRRTEEQAAESAFRQLYPAVWLPRVGSGGSLDLDKIEVGGRPLQATGIHERLLELLTVVGTRKLFDSIIPKKISERVKLGEAPSSGDPPRIGIATSAVLDAFFEFLEPPRIGSDSVLRKGIARGVGESAFAYTTGTPTIGAGGKFQVNLAKVVFGRAMSEDEVDLDAGFLIAPPALPSAEPTTTTTITGTEMTPGTPTTTTTGLGQGGPKHGGGTSARTLVRVTMTANRDEVFKAFKALANLSEKSDGGKISLVAEGQASAGYDSNWLRNAVEEPLDEANIDGLKID